MRNILTKWGRFVVLAALLLSGCFRPAGDSIQPTSNAATVQPGNQPLSEATATPGAPPITLLSPGTTAPTQAQAGPALTEVTVMPFEATATPSAVSGTVTATLQIITPGFSLNIVTPDTPTPLPTDDVVAPADLISAEATAAGTPAPTPEPLVSGAECTYTVEPGDSLYRIALLNDTNVAAMMAANPDLVGDPPVLQPGQVLKLPDCTPGEQSASEAPTAASGDNASATGGEMYTVKPGDTLYGIATQFGVTVNAIMRANDLSNPNALSIGQQLIIPPKSQ